MSSQAQPETALLTAQLDQMNLQNEKLKIELALAKKGPPKFSWMAQLVPMFSALVAVLGFVWGVVQYFEKQTETRNAQERQARAEQENAEREFMKPWLEGQRETYAVALSSAADIANSRDPAVVKRATDMFWNMYHGKMILVETTTVSSAMIQFGNCVSGLEKCSKEVMNNRCHALGSAMAHSMAATAKMTYREFSANRFEYKSGI